jgi:hypothetical protein
VIPRHNRNTLPISQLLEPRDGGAKLFFQGNVRQITSHHNMIWPLGLQVGNERVEHLGTMFLAPPLPPGEPTKNPFVHQRAQSWHLC